MTAAAAEEILFSQGRPAGRGRRCGEAGHRSRYLPHAKRALYHLSYFPGTVGTGSSEQDSPLNSRGSFALTVRRRSIHAGRRARFNM